MLRKVGLLIALACTFALSAQLVPGTEIPRLEGNLFLVDYNHDGRDDVIVGDRLLLSAGGGGFESPIALSIPSGQMAIDTLDLNGDGTLDLLTSDGDIHYPGIRPKVVSYHVAIGDRPAHFTRAADFPAGKTPYIADFDSDGRDDLLLATPDFTGVVATGTRIEFLRSRGDGTFDARGGVLIPPFYGTDFVRYSHLAAGDLNRDRRTDLVLRTSNEMVFFFGNGDGSFGAPVVRYLPQALGAVSPQLADVDSDGNLDVVFGGKDTIHVLLGDGTGHFPRAASAPMKPRDESLPMSPKNVAVGQFTGGNALEIAAANHDGDVVIFAWRSQKLAEVTRYASGYPAALLVPGNVQGFGRTDLFTTATASPVWIPWRFFFGRPLPEAQATVATPPASRRRGVRSGSNEFGLNVIFSDPCLANNKATWRFEREGIFLRTLEGNVEAALDGDNFYFRTSSTEYGMLAKDPFNQYLGQMFVNTPCGRRTSGVYATPE